MDLNIKSDPQILNISSSQKIIVKIPDFFSENLVEFFE